MAALNENGATPAQGDATTALGDPSLLSWPDGHQHLAGSEWLAWIVEHAAVPADLVTLAGTDVVIADDVVCSIAPLLGSHVRTKAKAAEIIGLVKAHGHAQIWPEHQWNQIGNVQRTLRYADGRLLWAVDDLRWFECLPSGLWRSPAAKGDDVGAKWVARAMEHAQIAETPNYDDEQRVNKKTGEAIEGSSKQEKFQDFMNESSKVDMHQAVATQIRRRAEDWGVDTLAASFDADPSLLAVANGVVDLRDGSLRPIKAADRIATSSPVVYHSKATSEVWDRYVAGAFPDPQEREAFRRIMGYSLMGNNHMRDQIFVIHYGVSGSGRSTLFGLLSHILGGHFGAANSRSVMQSKKGSTPAIGQDMIDLRGRRMLVLGETDEGAHLDVATVKALSGGDVRSDRPHARANVQYRISGSIHIHTNHLPHITPDRAMERRLIVVPWLISHTGEDRIVGLEQKLRDESTAVLAWLVAGAVAAHRDGLTMPAAWQAAKAEHFADEDEVARWLESEALPADVNDKHSWTAAKALYASYKNWRMEEMLEGPAMSPTSFGRRLTERGYPNDRVKTDKTRVVRPIRLRPKPTNVEAFWKGQA